MNEIAVNGGRRMTLKEVAETTGASYRTVAKYAQKAGWTKNGKQTLLDEGQITIILEAMKRSIGQGGKRAAAGKERLALAMQGINTAQRRMTVREVAEVLDCNPETIKKHIREFWPDLMKNGVATYLTEAQVTVILEKIKQTTAEHRGIESINLQRSVVGVQTSQSRALRIDLLHRQIEAEMQTEINELEGKNRDLQAANESLSQEKEVLKIALNDSLQFYTVAKYNSAFKMGWTRHPPCRWCSIDPTHDVA